MLRIKKESPKNSIGFVNNTNDTANSNEYFLVDGLEQA